MFSSQKRAPVITIVMVSCALVVGFFPQLGKWLIYDRDAILHGEIWRLFTGHWVHFSTNHLVYDCLALGIAGAMIETNCFRGFGIFCVIAPWLIGTAVFVFDAKLRLYAGLSGLATGAVVYFALFDLRKRSLPPWIDALLLMAVLGKIIFELNHSQPIFVSTEKVAVEVCVTAHITGAVCAAIWFLATGFDSMLGEKRQRALCVTHKCCRMENNNGCVYALPIAALQAA